MIGSRHIGNVMICLFGKPTFEDGCDKLCGVKPCLSGVTTFCGFVLMASIAAKLREDLN